MAELAFKVGSRLGMSFWLVSVLPSTLFVAFMFVLFSAGALDSTTDLSAVGEAVGRLRGSDAALLSAAVLVVSVISHSIHVRVVRLLEGYWGTSPLARRLAVVGIRRHQRRAQRLQLKLADAALVLRETGNRRGWEGQTKLLPRVVAEQSHLVALQAYPDHPDRVMPTRFGNALRRHEDVAGAQYGLVPDVVLPVLELVVPAQRLRFLHSSRQQLDMAVRIWMLASLAFPIAAITLLNDGAWILCALLPSAMANLAYNAAINAAHEYGTALETVINVDRFAIYEHLRVTLPADTHQERMINQDLMRLLAGERSRSVCYEHATPAADGAIPGDDELAT